MPDPTDPLDPTGPYSSGSGSTAPGRGPAARRPAAPPVIDAGKLAGLLAAPERLRVFSALVLGASDVEGIVAATGLDVRSAVTALGRLVDGELVIGSDDTGWFPVERAFAEAARAAAPPPSPTGVDGEATPDAAKVLRAFVRDGRLLQIPMQRAKRLVVLELLAQEFEPGRRYSEKMVNLILGKWHADTAALRRYLVDEEYLSREAGVYWRSGGPVPVD